MSFVERVMRVMTHVNLGISLGLAAWVLWSGWQLVTGQITPTYRVAEVRALMSLARAGEPQPLHLFPVQGVSSALPPCHLATPAPQQAAVALSGADL